MTTLTTPDSAPAASLNGTADPGPLRAAHTPNFPALLRQLGASLLVTTYQTGKLVMVRDEGDHLNTHYRAFPSPMGLALADGGTKLAIGTTLQVWEFRVEILSRKRISPCLRSDPPRNHSGVPPCTAGIYWPLDFRLFPRPLGMSATRPSC
jgi:hypothetical protein